jgi:DNA-binding SARP family transcriptional activator/tetratricopeptide (TPR) repeat protein
MSGGRHSGPREPWERDARWVRTQFRLLGGIEARVDSHVVDVGHLRQCCVLAALLLNGNDPVPVDELIDRVWGQRPPQRARETLYSYVSRLRVVLAAADDVRIVHRSTGYQLTVDPESVDVHRFHLLLTSARGASDGEAALAFFQQALGLWRGRAFALLDTPWFNDMRSGLDRARLAAEVERNDLVLRLGRHTQVLGEMFVTAQEYPLHEQLAGQLMLALYRAGQPSEALAWYRQLRARLVDELGIDPGEPLRQLHQRILRADPALTGSPARIAVPRQVPAPPPTFTGRAVELAQLAKICVPAAICAIIGPGGMGKTWIAQRLAYEQRDRYPDGQLHVDLRGFDPAGAPVSPSTAIRGFLDALGVAPESVPADLDAQISLYRTLIADKRMLVVLDNAFDSTQIAPLLPGNANCTVVVTSRHQLTGVVTTHGATPLVLGLLTDEEAHQLLVASLGARRVAAEPSAVDSLLCHCGGLPLALGITAARAAVNPDLPLVSLAAELGETATRLDPLDAGDLAVNLRAVLSSSVDSLVPAAGRLFALLGVMPGPQFRLAAVASLAGLSTSDARGLLRQLIAAHLVNEPESGRYRMHDLLRLYAAEQSESLTERSVARLRLLNHYEHTAHAADRLLAPFRQAITPSPPMPGVSVEPVGDNVKALAWFTTEHADLLAAIDQAAELGQDMTAWRLAWALATYLDRVADWHGQAIVHTAALVAAQRLGDSSGHAYALRGLASAFIWLGRYEEARGLLLRVHDLFDDADPSEQAHTFRTLARSYAREGKPKQALPYDEEALRLYQIAGYACGQAIALNAIGWHHAHLDDDENALAYCEQALALHEEIGNRHGAAVTCDSLGYIHRRLNHFDQSIAWYQRAVELFDHMGDRYEMADTLASLGDIYAATGLFGQAQAAWTQAVVMLDKLGVAAAPLRARLQPISP